MDSQEPTEAFAARWTLLHGLFFDAAQEERAWEKAVSALTETSRGTFTAVLWDGGNVPRASIEDAVARCGGVLVEVRAGADGLYDGEDRLWERGRLRDVLEAADLGITGAAWAVAHTGTVALYGDARRGMWPSLLPPAHLIALRREDIVPGLAAGLERLASESPPPPEVKLVSGPSSTADIEGQLVVGVHGPGRVAVVVSSW